MSVDDLTLTLTGEHRLELLEDGSELHGRGRQDAELPRRGLAPEHRALWEVLMTDRVLADGDVVVSFNS